MNFSILHRSCHFMETEIDERVTTQQLPTENSYLMTRSELPDRPAVFLGGRVAW